MVEEWHPSYISPECRSQRYRRLSNSILPVYTHSSTGALVVVLVGGALGVVDVGEDGGAGLVHADQVVPTRAAVLHEPQAPYLRVVRGTGGCPEII